MRIITIIWVSFMLILFNQSFGHANEIKKGAPTLHILYYDNIEYEEDPYQFINGLPLEDFETHLKFFKAGAYNIIDLDDENRINKISGSNNIAIILNGNDDEALAFAAPLLQKYGYPVRYSLNLSNSAYRKPKDVIFNLPYLNIKPLEEQSDFTQKILNDATSRFRELFSSSPNVLLLKDIELYYQHQDIFKLYEFSKTLIPTNEANHIGANDTIFSYIAVQPSFGNLDILRTYLNRRPWPYKKLNATKYEDKKNELTKISWGMTLHEDLNFNIDMMSCISSVGTKADIFSIDNRIEIRYDKGMNTGAIQMHCTTPILDKNLNKTEFYQYVMLHEPVL